MNKKPVIKCYNGDENYWSYEYQFGYVGRNNCWIGYASNSLRNLKQKVKELKLWSAEISTKSGQFTYGQNFVDIYFYKPRYK
jgi:hypothetical protein